jgi:hypothetical protein
MTIKRILFRLLVRFLEFLTLAKKPILTLNLALKPLSSKSVDIITVAFNNVELIRYQNQFLRKFLCDEYCHIIVDNSTDDNARLQLQQWCSEEKIAYVGLPKNYLNRVGASYSHATALNYAYKYIVKKREPFVFGQIDHDLFPIKKMSILNKLQNQPIYGPLRLRDKCWYLSAIMSFFRYDYVRENKVDFMPVTPDKFYLDSGGGNWYSLYSSLDINKLVFPTECIEPLREGGDRHGDSLEYFDEKSWLHTINGSCWKEISNQSGKNSQVRSFLDRLLNNP